MLAIVQFFYHNPLLSWLLVIGATTVTIWILKFVEKPNKFLFNFYYGINLYVVGTLILLLTMSVIRPDVVGTRIPPIWNPIPSFQLAIGTTPVNRDQLMLLSANILLTIPLAALLRITMSRGWTLAVAEIVVLSTETAQWLIADGRTFEISDILTNTLGIWLGIKLFEVVEILRSDANKLETVT